MKIKYIIVVGIIILLVGGVGVYMFLVKDKNISENVSTLLGNKQESLIKDANVVQVGDYKMIPSSKFNAYFKNNSNVANSIAIESKGYMFYYDISGGQLEWRGTANQPNAIDTLGGGVTSNSKDTNLSIKGNVVSYPNAFSNTNLSYTINAKGLKEIYTLSGLPSMKNNTYLEYTGTIRFNKTLSICANKVCYIPKGTQDDFETSGQITLVDSNNNTVFFLPSPVITDKLGHTVTGLYSVHGSNAQMNFWLRIPTSFIRTATFPLMIDPSVIVISTAQHLDANRTLIEDVTPLVIIRDFNYTSVPDKDYLRVSFVENLTNKNDISFWAKSNGSANITIYKKNNNTIVATVNNVSAYRLYKVLLTSMLNRSDVFDLLVTGNTTSFDFILDPVGTCSGSLDCTVWNNDQTSCQTQGSTVCSFYQGTCTAYDCSLNYASGDPNNYISCQGLFGTYADVCSYDDPTDCHSQDGNAGACVLQGGGGICTYDIFSAKCYNSAGTDSCGTTNFCDIQPSLQACASVSPECTLQGSSPTECDNNANPPNSCADIVVEDECGGLNPAGCTWSNGTDCFTKIGNVLYIPRGCPMFTARGGVYTIP